MVADDTRSIESSILLVEDDVLSAMRTRRGLEQKGYGVTHVASTEQAIETALDENSPIDIILMDLELGSGIDGVQAAEEIVEQKAIPIVFLYSQTAPDIVERTEHISSYGYVVKDSSVTVLDASIKTALTLFNANRAAHEKKALQQEDEALLRALIETIPDLIWLKDPDGVYLACNPKFERFFGAKESEIVGKTDYDFVKKEQADFFREKDKAAMETGRPNINEEEITQADDGQRLWLETIKTPMYDSQGRLLGVLGIARDITERKRTEEQLRESEAKFKTIFENKGTATGTFDDDGIITSCNTKFAELSGYTKEELIGTMRWSDFVDGEDRDRLQNYHAQRTKKVENSPPTQYECWILDKSGQRKCVAVNVGTSESWRIVSLADITERVNAEKALKEGEERFRALHNASFGGIAIHDKGIILECNKGLSDISGYQYDELVGIDGLELISDDTRDRVIQNIYAGHEQPYEATGVRKNGETYPLRLQAGNAHYKGKNVRVVEFRDITESKRIERELHRHRAHLEELVSERTAALQAANDDLRNFAYIASHDLKAPLRAISRLANWLAEDYADVIDTRGKELTELLIGRVKRMDNLIDGILEYSRIGRVITQYRPVNLNELVMEIIDTLSPPEHIMVMIENNLPVIVGDRIRLAQLFQNLIENAIKFLETSKGDVRIGCMEDESQWKFWVTDTGPGIEERYHERIFQIFQTLHPFDEKGNTGVGLAIVKKIVEFYHGKIWVESTLGEGCTFFFLLPKTDSPDPCSTLDGGGVRA